MDSSLPRIDSAWALPSQRVPAVARQRRESDSGREFSDELDGQARARHDQNEERAPIEDFDRYSAHAVGEPGAQLDITA